MSCDSLCFISPVALPCSHALQSALPYCSSQRYEPRHQRHQQKQQRQPHPEHQQQQNPQKLLDRNSRSTTSAVLTRPRVRINPPIVTETVDVFSPISTSSPTTMPSTSNTNSTSASNSTHHETAPADPVVIIPGFCGTGTDYLLLEQELQASLPPGTVVRTVPLTRVDWLQSAVTQSVEHIISRLHDTVCEAVAQNESGHRGGVVTADDDNNASIITTQCHRSSENKSDIDEYMRTKNSKHNDYCSNILTRKMRREAERKCSSDDKSVNPRKVSIVAHSAGGWISRLYLGDQEYKAAGGAWHGHRAVQRLICLGSPHMMSSGARAGCHVAFANQEYPAAFFEAVEYVCLAGDGGSVGSGQGRGFPLLDRHWMARFGYSLCDERLRSGPVIGDGIVPVDAAMLDGAEANIRLRGVYHSQRSKGPWYGHPTVVQYWSRFLV